MGLHRRPGAGGAILQKRIFTLDWLISGFSERARERVCVVMCEDECSQENGTHEHLIYVRPVTIDYISKSELQVILVVNQVCQQH